MRQKSPNLVLVFIPLLFLACSVFQPEIQSTPSLPPSTPTAAESSPVPTTPAPEATLEPVSSPIVRLADQDVFCPTENEEARKLYNEAGDRKDSGDLQEAEDLYLQAIELDPGYCDAMDNLGQMLRQQDRVDEAIEWYQKSLEILPENTVALQNLALAYNLQGNTEKAMEAYEKLVEVAPENPEGHFGLGSVYYALNQPEQAIPHFETAEKLYLEAGSPYAMDAQYYLGFSHFLLEDCAQAGKYFEPIYAQLSEDGGINYALGICALEKVPPNMKAARVYILKAQELGIKIPAEVLEAIEEK